MAYSVAALKRVKPRYAAVTMMTLFRSFLLISMLNLLLVACGQRGPLYLPDDSPPVVVPAQASQPPAAQPPVSTAVPPDTMDGGFEDEDSPDEDDPKDNEADGV